MLVFVKNWLFTGNPFYPFLHHLFPSPYWTDTAAEYFKNAVRRHEILDWHWWTFFSFPLRMTLRPLLIDTHPGILPLVLIPMLFFRSPHKGVTFLKTFVVSSVLVWLVIQTETRSLLTMLAVFFCVAALGLEHLVWNHKTLRRPLIFFLALAVLANLGIALVTNYHLTNPMGYFLGLETRETFLLREAKGQLSYQWLNRNPAADKVLLVGLFGPYYLEKPVYFSSVCDPPIVERLSAGIENPGSLQQRFRSLGITHVVVHEKQYNDDNRFGLFAWPAEQKKAFEDFLAQFCQPAAKFGKEVIYRVK